MAYRARDDSAHNPDGSRKKNRMHTPKPGQTSISPMADASSDDGESQSGGKVRMGDVIRYLLSRLAVRCARALQLT